MICGCLVGNFRSLSVVFLCSTLVVMAWSMPSTTLEMWWSATRMASSSRSTLSASQRYTIECKSQVILCVPRSALRDAVKCVSVPYGFV